MAVILTLLRNIEGEIRFIPRINVVAPLRGGWQQASTGRLGEIHQRDTDGVDKRNQRADGPNDQHNVDCQVTQRIPGPFGWRVATLCGGDDCAPE